MYRGARNLKLKEEELHDLLRYYEMLGDQRKFDNLEREVVLDPKTGEMNFIEDVAEKQRNVDPEMLHWELEKFKATYKLTEEDIKRNSIQDTAINMEEYRAKIMNEFDIDPTKFFIFGWDFTRIDCGMILARPAIFNPMVEPDRKFMKTRFQLMKEYYCDEAQYNKEMEEVSRSCGNPLRDNPYHSLNNMDNIPTHWITDEKGENHDYSFSTKNWRLVDPDVKDPHFFHYAAASKVYLIFKNRFSQQWEFPTTPMFFGNTFYKTREDLFKTFSEGWTSNHLGWAPIIQTVRDFTEAEREDVRNNHYKGVWTYYFCSMHKRGIPRIMLDNTTWEDWAWVPKVEFNKYFSKDQYTTFIDSLDVQ